MTKDEALDLALEALEKLKRAFFKNASTAKEIEQGCDRGYEDYEAEFVEPALKAITAIKQARALDKMADNAIELGLDYEPVLKDNSNYRYDPPAAQPAPVAFEVGLVEWVGNKLMATPKVTTTPPAQPAPVQEPVPDYAWPAVADYEKDVGFEVNDAFKMAWDMARTTNALFTQVEKNNG